jgi:hypothetical protein
MSDFIIIEDKIKKTCHILIVLYSIYHIYYIFIRYISFLLMFY